MKNKYQEALDFIIDHTHPMCETTKDLEALDFSYNILQELVDKETPMKPEYISLLTNPPQHRTMCGNCNGVHLEKVFKFCPYCGQKIDWSKDE